MSVATIKPTTAGQPRSYMCGSVLTNGKKPKEFPAPAPYKPTHTVSPAGLPATNDSKPYKAQHDFAMRLVNTEAQQRFAELIAHHASDSDEAAELLRQTHASLIAARELHEIERLQSMGLSKDRIAQVMENRLEELARRHGRHHDSHGHVLEQISHLAKGRKIPGLALHEDRGMKQSMSTREGLLSPHFDFTQKEVNTVKHGLMAFAKAQRTSHLESLQKAEEENVADALTGKGPGKSQAEKRLNELIAAGAYRRAVPVVPAVGGPPNARPQRTPAVGGGMAVARGRARSADALRRELDFFTPEADAQPGTPPAVAAFGGAGAGAGAAAPRMFPPLHEYTAMSRGSQDRVRAHLRNTLGVPPGTRYQEMIRMWEDRGAATVRRP